MARSSSESSPANPAIAYSTRIERAMEERRSLTAYVDDTGIVRRIQDEAAFSSLLADETLRVHDTPEALDVAETFLRIRFFSGVMLWGWRYGINAIASVDEIVFAANDAGAQQRLAVENAVAISPPTIESIGEKYVLSLFSWSPVSGDLMRVEVRVGRGGDIEFDEHVLLREVGEFGSY